MTFCKKRNLNFIHLHKCCGKSITSMLESKNFTTVRLQGYTCHDGVNEAPTIKKIINFISTRDIIDIYCSKVSYFNINEKNISKQKLLQSLTDLVPRYLYHKKTGLDKRDKSIFREKKLKLKNKFPEIGLATHQLLFQTCLIEDEIKEDNIEDFFKNNNIIDFIARKDSLDDDLSFILGESINTKYKNTSKNTETVKSFLTDDLISKIHEREWFFQKVHLGEYNDLLRGHR